MLSAIMLKMAFPAWMDNLAWIDVQAKRQPESQNGYYLVSAPNFRLLEAAGINTYIIHIYIYIYIFIIIIIVIIINKYSYLFKYNHILLHASVDLYIISIFPMSHFRFDSCRAAQLPHIGIDQWKARPSFGPKLEELHVRLPVLGPGLEDRQQMGGYTFKKWIKWAIQYEKFGYVSSSVLKFQT